MKKEKIIHLDAPLMLKGAPVFELTMHEPTMADEEDAMVMAVDMGRAQNPLTGEMCMYSLLCGIPYDVIRTMKTAEYEKLRTTYREFVRPQPIRAANAGTPPVSLDISAEV